MKNLSGKLRKVIFRMYRSIAYRWLGIGKKVSKSEVEEGKKIEEDVVGLIKFVENPIIKPDDNNGWEAYQTFNPGVIAHESGIHLVYRAIGHDGVSRLGYAYSSDGKVIEKRGSGYVFEHVDGLDMGTRVFSPHQHCHLHTGLLRNYSSGGSWGGCEDPRLVWIKEDRSVYMTYTYIGKRLGVALTSISEEDFFGHKWSWRTPAIISNPRELHKNWVIFPEKINGKYAILHSLSPDISLAYLESLDFGQGEFIHSDYGRVRREGVWDTYIRGAGAPPIKTDRGWLIFYHANDEKDSYQYKVGAMLLDLDRPEKVLYRSSKPVLEPDMEFENNGFKAGVIYVSGAAVRDDNLYVYYGASDSYVGVATARLSSFIDELVESGIKE